MTCLASVQATFLLSQTTLFPKRGASRLQSCKKTFFRNLPPGVAAAAIIVAVVAVVVVIAAFVVVVAIVVITSINQTFSEMQNLWHRPKIINSLFFLKEHKLWQIC